MTIGPLPDSLRNRDVVFTVCGPQLAKTNYVMPHKVGKEYSCVFLDLFKWHAEFLRNFNAGLRRIQTFLQHLPDLRAYSIQTEICPVARMQDHGFVADPTIACLVGYIYVLRQDIGYGHCRPSV